MEAINIEHLKRAVVVTSMLVAAHGTTYLPVFQRLQGKLIEVESKIASSGHKIGSSRVVA